MSSQGDSSQSTECPICFNKFNADVIENHVNRCLFLNEPTSATEKQPKRPAAFAENDAVVKKPRNSLHGQIFKKAGSHSPSSKAREARKTDNKISFEKSSVPADTSNDTSVNKSKKTLEQEELIPLAERVRPLNIISYVGQSHIIGPQSVLYKLLSKNEIPNVILWGPPGCGKTSLATVIGNVCKNSPQGKYHFVKLSAAIADTNDVKKVVTVAANDLKFGRRTVIFFDEIHRFNKVQQDIFLPHIESGTITLVGATTENPCYTLNPALLSRCQVMVLEKLSVDHLVNILENAVKASKGAVVEQIDTGKFKKKKITDDKMQFFISDTAIKWLAETSDGDARIALGGLELAIKYKNSESDSEQKRNNVLSLDDIKESLKKTHQLYDKTGDQHYDMISALHKSIRASNENAALYWLTRMITGGESPVYIARRLVRQSSEDVGLKDPKALAMAVQTMQACIALGKPDSDILLARCVTYLSRAPKSRLMEDSVRAAQSFVRSFKDVQPSVPLHLRKLPVSTNSSEDNETEISYLPEEIEDVDFLKEFA